MAMKSLRKALILVIRLIILAIFKAHANVLTPPSLRPTSLPIRLLQSSQLSINNRRHCVKSTIEKCEHITKTNEMRSCITEDLIPCIFRIEFPTIKPTNPTKFGRAVKIFLAKVTQA